MAGVVLAAAVAGGALVATGGPDPATPEFPTAVPALSLGDDRTADPCGPVRPEALQAFGRTTPVPDYGNFASCQIEVSQRGSDTIQVSSRYRPSSSTPPEGEQERLGQALIVRRPADGEACQRYVVLADGTPLEIRAGFEPSPSGTRGPLSDVCAVAEAAAASAATTFAEDGVVRRTPPGTGLWTTDACTLLTAGDLTFLPPGERTDGYRNVGGWQCEWGDDKDPETSVMISFDRYSPPQQTGDPAPWTPAFVDRDEEDGVCNAEVPKQPFLGSGGRPQAEVLRVKTEGPLDRRQLCERAVALATAADART